MTTDGWTLASAVQQADRYIEELGLPVEARPTGMGKEYAFPEDVSKLTSHELARHSSQMERAWSYGSQRLSRDEDELTEFENLYEIKVGLRMHEESGRIQGRQPVKEILRALAIEGDPELKQLTRNLVVRRLSVKRLATQVKIYQSHLVRLSREQSRRESEARLGIGG